MDSIKIRLAAYTDPAGKWNDDAPNKGNEDNMLVVSDLKGNAGGSFASDENIPLGSYGCLMVVADGMGGMNAGEVASAIAIDVVKQAFSEGKLTDDIAATAESRAKYMENVVIAADDAIKREAASNESCSGMGSTIIMAWLCGTQLTVTWCGDSRTYLFRPSVGLRQVSKDHSYVQSLVDEGKITMDEAFDHPYNNIVTRSLGDPEKKCVPESMTVEVCEGDVVMVCSDGLSGALRDGEMQEIIKVNRESMSGCRKALWAAAEKMWYDNVTAILCEVTSGPAAPAEPALDNTNGEGKKSLGRSFVSLRISKRALRIALPVAVVVVLGLAACLLAPPHIGRNDQVPAERIYSLAHVAETCGLAFLYDKFNSLKPDDVDSVVKYENVLSERQALLSRIDDICDRCNTSYVGLRNSLSELRETVKRREMDGKEVEEGLSSVEASLETLDGILSDMEKFAKGKPEDVVEQLDEFKESLLGKSSLTQDDKKAWDKKKALLAKNAKSSAKARANGGSNVGGGNPTNPAGKDGAASQIDTPRQLTPIPSKH